MGEPQEFLACTAKPHDSTPRIRPNPETLKSPAYMGGRQNYGPFLGTLKIRCRVIIGTQKGTILLTTTHIHLPLNRRPNPHTPSINAVNSDSFELTQKSRSIVGHTYSGTKTFTCNAIPTDTKTRRIHVFAAKRVSAVTNLCV